MKIGILGPVTTSKYFGVVARFEEEIANGFEHKNCQVVLLIDQKEEKINKDKFNIKTYIFSNYETHIITSVKG